jgi:hypothetical protein
MESGWISWILVAACICAPAAHAQDDPAAIIRKAITGMGGPEIASQWTGPFRLKMKGIIAIDGYKYAAQSETVFQPPDRIRTILTSQNEAEQHRMIEVLNGKKAWRKDHDETEGLDTPKTMQLMHGLYSQRVEALVPLLTESIFQLSTLPAAEVEGRDAAGVRVSSKQQADIDLFFDKQTGLLVKSERMAMDPDRDDVRREDYFRNYRDSAGGKHWTTLAIYEDGKLLLQMDVVSLQCVDRIPDQEFAKP